MDISAFYSNVNSPQTLLYESYVEPKGVSGSVRPAESMFR